MHPRKQRRFILLGVSLAGLAMAAGLVFFALGDALTFYYVPSDVVAGKAPTDRHFRLGGMVQEGSLVKGKAGQVSFIITDYQQQIPVSYHGTLPALFAEGEGVVATGTLSQSGHFNAHEILAKHDENYMPPEVAKLMEKQKDEDLP